MTMIAAILNVIPARMRPLRILPVLLLLLVALVLQESAAQPGDPGRKDSTDRSGQEWGEDWTMDSLDLEDFDFYTEDIYHKSTGWLPTPYTAASISLYSGFIYNDTYDRATGLRTNAFRPTTEPFDWHDPYNCSGIGQFFGFDCKEKQILRSDSDEPLDDGYPGTSYGEYGLRFLYHLPFPAIIRAEGAYRQSNGLLFSEDTSRAYLSLDGLPRSFREIGVVYRQSEGIAGMIGLQIPVYGVFIDSDYLTVGSYYYLFGGFSAGYSIFTRTTQYTQIADAKDQIRYENGQDTLMLMRTGSGDGINRLRTAWEGGIGWQFTGAFAVFGFEAFISSPLNSVVPDGDWKQYYGGIRINIGYEWGTRSSKNTPF